MKLRGGEIGVHSTPQLLSPRLSPCFCFFFLTFIFLFQSWNPYPCSMSVTLCGTFPCTFSAYGRSNSSHPKDSPGKVWKDYPCWLASFQNQDSTEGGAGVCGQLALTLQAYISLAIKACTPAHAHRKLRPILRSLEKERMFHSSRFLWGHSVIVQQEEPGPRDGVTVTSHYLPLGSLRL